MLATPLTGYHQRWDSIRPPVAFNLRRNAYPGSSASWLYKSALFQNHRVCWKHRSDLDGAISSDHKLLLAELPRRAKRTRVKAAQCKKVFNVDRFHDPEHGERDMGTWGHGERDIGLYMQCLRRRLPEFEAFVEEAYNQQNTWGAHKAVREKFHVLVEAAAEEAIGSKKVVPGISKSWWTAEITDAIKARRQIHAEWRSQGGTEAWQAYEEAREKVHKMVKDARSLFTKSARFGRRVLGINLL